MKLGRCSYGGQVLLGFVLLHISLYVVFPQTREVASVRGKPVCFHQRLHLAVYVVSVCVRRVFLPVWAESGSKSRLYSDMYIYIYIYKLVYVCVSVVTGASPSFSSLYIRVVHRVALRTYSSLSLYLSLSRSATRSVQLTLQHVTTT